MFSESQGNESGNMRIDVGGPAESSAWLGNNCVTSFDPSELWIPRFGKTYCFFNPGFATSPWLTDRPKEYIVDSIVKYSNSDDQHHYWFNTFEHGVDGCRTDTDPSNDSSSVIGLVPYLYYHYGPGGDNTIWVAPSEVVFSYVITQRHATLTAASVTAYTGSSVCRAVSNGLKVFSSAIARKMVPGNRSAFGNAEAYDIQGHRIVAKSMPANEIYIVKR
jgi:hypothetical protein